MRLALIKPEHEGSKVRALTTTPSLPRRDFVKMPYLNQMNEKKAIGHYT